jgi:hypothetical protein
VTSQPLCGTDPSPSCREPPTCVAHFGRSHYVKTRELRSDDWILNAHATWMLLVGAVLLRAALSGRVSDETPLLGLGSSLGQALNDARACCAGYPGSTDPTWCSSRSWPRAGGSWDRRDSGDEDSRGR